MWLTPRCLQQRLGPDAVRADWRRCTCLTGVHAAAPAVGGEVADCSAVRRPLASQAAVADSVRPAAHRVAGRLAQADFSIGRLASRQAAVPPASVVHVARSRPCAAAPLHARARAGRRTSPPAAAPCWSAGPWRRPAGRAARCARPRHGRRRTRPARARRSARAFSRLISRTASAVPTPSRPCRPC